MEFEWDEHKRLRNVAKHGVDFVDVAVALGTSDHVRYRSDQKGEVRFVGCVDVQGRRVAVVYTETDTKVRIISARKWKRRDDRKLGELHAG